MPKKIITLQLVRVFGDDQEMFDKNSIKPNIPRRFAIIMPTNDGTKPILWALSTPDEILDLIAFQTMFGREYRIEGVSRYFTESDFKLYAEAKLREAKPNDFD